MRVRDEELADIGQGATDLAQGLLEERAGAAHSLAGIDQRQTVLAFDCVDVDRSELVVERERDPVNPGRDEFRSGLGPVAARGRSRGLGDTALVR